MSFKIRNSTKQKENLTTNRNVKIQKIIQNQTSIKNKSLQKNQQDEKEFKKKKKNNQNNNT